MSINNYSGLLNYYAGDFKGKFVDFMDFSVDITGNATYVVYDTIDDERHVASCNLSTSGSYGGVVGTLNYGSDIQFSVYEAELGAKITLQDVQVIVVDYAGEIDESIDTSVPYTLKNISPFIYSYQYDLSMLPPQYGKLTIEFEPAESGDGLRLNGCDYYGSEIDLKVPVDQGQTSAEIYVNKPEMEILRNTTMHLYSENLKITKVTFVHEPRDPSIFEYGDNNCELTLDSKNEYIYIPGSAFEELSEKGSSPVTITFETDSSVSDPWVQYRYGLSDLHKITSVEHVKGKTTYKADLFGSVPEVKEKGLYIFGNGVTITNVNIYKGNPCTGGDPDVIEELTPEEVKDVEFVDSFDSESLFTSTTNGFGINKMYSQKNELGNGKYNQRFIMQVKTADVADIYSYSIIISSGTKNVKINCYGLSSSITINGNNIKADEGCVFLSAAVVDVNDSVELSYSDFTYEHGGVVDEA